MPEVDRLFISLGAVNTELVQKLEESKRKVQEFGNSVKQTGESSSLAMEALAERAKKVGDLYSKLGARLQVFGGALVAFVSGAVYEFARFEKGVANVISLLGDVSEEARELQQEYGAFIRRLASETGVSSEALAVALYNIVSAGFRGEEALRVLAQSARASVAGLTDVAQTAQMLTAVINAYGMESSDVTRVSDILFQTVKRGVTTFQEISEYMGQVTSVASALGISLEEISAILAYATRNGIDFRRAVTQLRSIITHLVAPTDEAREVMQGLGININETSIRTEGLIANIAKLQGLTVEQVKRIVQVQEALPLMAALLNDVGGVYEDYNEMLNSANATQQAFEVNAQSLSVSLGRLRESGKAFLVEFAQPLVPILDSLSGKVSALTKVFSSLPPIFKDTVSYLAAFGGASSLLLGSLLRLGVAMRDFRARLLEVYGSTSLITAGFSMVRSGWRTLVSALTSGVTLVVGSLAAIGMAVYAIWKDIKRGGAEARDTFRALAEEIKRIDPQNMEALEDAMGRLTKAIEETSASTNRLISIMNLLGKLRIDVSGLGMFRNAIDAIIERQLALMEAQSKATEAMKEKNRELAQQILKTHNIQSESSEELIRRFLEINDALGKINKEIDQYTRLIQDAVSGILTVPGVAQEVLIKRLEELRNESANTALSLIDDATEIREKLIKAGIDVAQYVGKSTEEIKADVEEMTKSIEADAQKVADSMKNIMSVLEIMRQVGEISSEEYVDYLRTMAQSSQDASDQLKAYYEQTLSDMLKKREEYQREIAQLEEREQELLEETRRKREEALAEYHQRVVDLANQLREAYGEILSVERFEDFERASSYIEQKLQELSLIRKDIEAELQSDLSDITAKGVEERISEEAKLPDAASEFAKDRLQIEKVLQEKLLNIAKDKEALEAELQQRLINITEERSRIEVEYNEKIQEIAQKRYQVEIELQDTLLAIDKERLEVQKELEDAIRSTTASESKLTELTKALYAYYYKIGKPEQARKLFELEPEEALKKLYGFYKKYGLLSKESIEEALQHLEEFDSEFIELAEDWAGHWAELGQVQGSILDLIKPFEDYQKEMKRLNNEMIGARQNASAQMRALNEEELRVQEDKQRAEEELNKQELEAKDKHVEELEKLEVERIQAIDEYKASLSELAQKVAEENQRITETMQVMESQFTESMTKITEESMKAMGQIANDLQVAQQSLAQVNEDIPVLSQKLKELYPVMETGLPAEFSLVWKALAAHTTSAAEGISLATEGIMKVSEVAPQGIEPIGNLASVVNGLSESANSATGSLQSLARTIQSLPTEKVVTVKVRYVAEGNLGAQGTARGGPSPADLLKSFRDLERAGDLIR